MTLLLDDTTVQSVFDWNLAIAALRNAYAAADDDARYPSRVIARGGGNWLRTLSGVPGDSGLMGAKTIAGAMSAGGCSYLISLFDQATAELVALLDGTRSPGIAPRRPRPWRPTCWRRPGPLSVAVIGSGFEAKNHVRALASVRELETVQVYSPRSGEPERLRRRPRRPGTG